MGNDSIRRAVAVLSRAKSDKKDNKELQIAAETANFIRETLRREAELARTQTKVKYVG